mmetsp:Transcript_26664/g.73337  ORF Transcript_26664/g.73337 Transcript_26664/m.73337 type:complete len:180 (-) Transcript_26664:7923-8462(-)
MFLALWCLLVTTHSDYGGKATEYLTTIASAERPGKHQLRIFSHISNGKNDLASSSIGLEFRTWHTMSRLAETMHSRVLQLLVELDSGFDHDPDAIGSDMDWEIEVEISRRLGSGALGLDGSPEWTRIWVLLEELETLSLLSDHLERQKNLLRDRDRDRARTFTTRVGTADYFVRESSCQ